MPNWLTVVLVVAGLAAVAAFGERWRLAGMEKSCRTRGLRLLVPFVAGDRPPVALLASRFDVRGARRWGAGVEGPLDGLEVITLAEHETSPPGRKTGQWQTMMVWPIRGGDGPIVLWPGARGPASQAILSVTGDSDARVAERLGVPDADPSVLRVTTEGGLLVEGEPDVLKAWLTEARVRALESWPHGGEFVKDRGYGAWRVRGLLTPGRFEARLQQFPAARLLLE